jgi:GTPase SAR1 family protein
MFETTSSSELAIRFINQTNRSIFLTGKAGTGKTTLLKRIITTTHKKSVIVAPTGIAALNAGGVTIHSFFQLPFSGFIPEFGVTPRFNDRLKWETKDTLVKHFRIPAKRKALFQSMELLVIDEVSMLRADLLDAIDWTLRTIRKRNEPFGGVQVLFIGDLLQLPPVVKNEEWAELKNYYSGIFFFHAKVVQ